MFYICKGYRSLSTCENVSLMRLVLCQYPCDLFFSYFALVEEMIHVMIKKIMELHMLPNLASTVIVVARFDF
jgi:hypothetical protein